MQKNEKEKQMYIFLIIVVLGFIGAYMWQTTTKATGESDLSSSLPDAQQKQIMKNISPKEAHEMIQQYADDKNFVILDVRTPAEFKAGRIENSVNLDYYAKTFQKDLDTLDKEKTYLIYCRSANRSGRTLPLMRKLGFQEVYNMTGGIGTWYNQKFPVVK